MIIDKYVNVKLT